MRGFEPVSLLTQGAIRQAAGQRGFAVARLLTHWPEIVGEDLARLCRPVRMSHGTGMGATLVLLTTGPHAPMLEMRAPAIREAVNACFGYHAVARISLTQTAATGFSEGQAQFSPAPASAAASASRPVPSSQTEAAADQVVAGVSDPRYRASLRALAISILSRRDAPTTR